MTTSKEAFNILDTIELSVLTTEKLRSEGLDTKESLIVVGATIETLKAFVPEYKDIEYTKEGVKEVAKKVKEFFLKLMRKLRDVVRAVKIKFSAWLAKDREEANKLVPKLEEILKSNVIKDDRTMDFFDIFNAYVMRFAIESIDLKIVPLKDIQKWNAGSIQSLTNDIDKTLRLYAFPASRVGFKSKDKIVFLSIDTNGTLVGFINEDSDGRYFIRKTATYGFSGLPFIISTLNTKSMLESVIVYLTKANVPDVKKLADQAVKALDEIEKVVDKYAKDEKLDSATLALVKKTYAQYGYLVTVASRRTSVEYRGAVRLAKRYIKLAEEQKDA